MVKKQEAVIGYLERRSSVRVKRVLSIRHRLHKRAGKTFREPWYLSTTEDMSYNGILFSSSALYQVDDILEVEVVMSGVLDIFKGYGQVVRVEKNSSGTLYDTAVRLIDLKKTSPKPAARQPGRTRSAKRYN